MALPIICNRSKTFIVQSINMKVHTYRMCMKQPKWKFS